jgi:hypothetical protein
MDDWDWTGTVAEATLSMNFQIPSTKSQISSNDQNPKHQGKHSIKSLRVVFPAACGEFVIPAEAGIQKTGLDSASSAE